MGRRMLAAVRPMARFSRSTAMARVLRTCTVSVRGLVFILILPTAMELFRKPDWFYRAILCMGRRSGAALLAMARSSPSTPIAQVLRTYIILQQPLVLLLPPTATERIRLLD